LPPGLEPPPILVPFGSAPVIAIQEKSIPDFLVGLELPPNIVIRTSTANIPAGTWNATTGMKLRQVPVQVGKLAQTTLASLINPALTNAVAAYFAAGGAQSLEIAENGQVETAWIGEIQHQHYLQLSKLRGANGWTDGDPDPWPVKYVNQRPWYALNAARLGLLKLWNSQP